MNAGCPFVLGGDAHRIRVEGIICHPLCNSLNTYGTH